MSRLLRCRCLFSFVAVFIALNLTLQVWKASHKGGLEEVHGRTKYAFSWNAPKLWSDRKVWKDSNKKSYEAPDNDSRTAKHLEFESHGIQIDCKKLLQSNGENSPSESSTSAIPDTTTDDDVIQILGQGCPEFHKRYRFITVEENYTDQKEETNFPIAYSILVHEKIHQFVLLLSAIYRKQNLYCVHLDAKSDKKLRYLLETITSCFPNVFLSTKSEKIVYASFYRLLADVRCMEDLLFTPKNLYNWKYVINLCGQDFPISTNLEIVRQLKELKGRNSIAGTSILNDIAKRRTDFVHELKNVTNNQNETVVKDVETTRRHVNAPYNITVKKNLAYNAFTREFLQWALIDSREGQALLNWSSVTHTPDEHFWSMLNTYPGAPGGSSFISWWQVCRAIMWSYSINKESCHGYWRRNVCVFGAGDLPWLMRQPQMFANKFDVSHDATPVRCLRHFLDERAYGKENRITNLDKNPLILPKEFLQ